MLMDIMTDLTAKDPQGTGCRVGVTHAPKNAKDYHGPPTFSPNLVAPVRLQLGTAAWTIGGAASLQQKTRIGVRAKPCTGYRVERIKKGDVIFFPNPAFST